jgi:hypothetical protein
MIDIPLTAQHLGTKIKIGDETGTIKAYNNQHKIAFIVIDGKVIKYPYQEITL